MVVVTVVVVIVVVIVVVSVVVGCHRRYHHCDCCCCLLLSSSSSLLLLLLLEAITHIEKLIGGSSIHPTMVPFAMVVDRTFGEIDWRQQIQVDPNKGCHHVD